MIDDPKAGPRDRLVSRSRAKQLDIARESGVSLATVDRVLNRRSGVRHETVQRVLRVAADMGYLPDTAEYSTVLHEPMKLMFVLPKNNNAFIRMVGDYVEIVQRNFAPFNIDCHVRYVEEYNPQVLADSLLKYGKRFDGIAFIALEHPIVREAVKQIVEQGKHVLTIVNDLSNSMRCAFVGQDNHAAGRTAGLLMGRQIGDREGKIALVAGSVNYRAQYEREMGFQQVQREMFPRLRVVGALEGREDAVRTYELVRDLLRQHPDLLGIYNVGGGWEGVGRALKEAHLDDKIVFIGHDIISGTRSLLIDGTMDVAITQNPQAEVINAIRIFTNLRDKKPLLAGVEAIGIGIVVRENLP